MTGQETRIALDIGAIPFGAWLTMLALGDIHLDIVADCPNLGFWACVALLAAIGVVSTVVRRGLDMSA